MLHMHLEPVAPHGEGGSTPVSQWHALALPFALCALYRGTCQVWRTRALRGLKGEALDALARAVGYGVGVPAPAPRAAHIVGLAFVVAVRTGRQALVRAGVLWPVAFGIERGVGAPLGDRLTGSSPQTETDAGKTRPGAPTPARNAWRRGRAE